MSDWKTVDDFLPTLKYGTQLPPPRYIPSTIPAPLFPGSSQLGQQVSVINIDLPFLSILKLLFKCAAAGVIVSLCFIPAFIAFWLVIVAIMAALFGGAASFRPH